MVDREDHMPDGWTVVRLTDGESSPGSVQCDATAEHMDPQDAAIPAVNEVEALRLLQKQLDDESVARFVERENAVAARAAQVAGDAHAHGSDHRCPCLGASQGMHRPNCPLRQNQ